MAELLDWEGPRDLSNNDYHSLDEWSASNIKEMNKSALHYKRIVIDGEKLESKNLEFGTIAHSCILEGRFPNLQVIPSKWETMADQKKRGVEKPRSVADQKQDFIDHHEGFVVSESDYEVIEGLVTSFESDDVAQSILSEDDIIEKSYLFYDEEHDIKCRFRPDIINPKEGKIVDYKTCASAQESSFQWAVIRYGYHISAAHYIKGAQRLFPEVKSWEFYFIAQEKKHPFACATYKLSETDISFGMTLRSHLIKRIQQCTERDDWPSYTPEIRELCLPDAGYNLEGMFDEA